MNDTTERSIRDVCDVPDGITSAITETYDSEPPWADEQPNWNGRAWHVVLKYQGRRMSTKFYTGEKAGDPDTASVLDCLLSDASLVDGTEFEYATFSDFCAELGYNEDSRKAEKSWRQCKSQTRRLSRLLGHDFETFLYHMDRL